MSFMCEKCSGEYGYEKSLKRHLSQCTGESRLSGNCNTIKCPECKKSLVNMDSLKTHIEDGHDVKLEEETLFFKSVPEFRSWKENMERENNCYYYQKSNSWSSNVKRTYFFCHRSGCSKSKSKGLRRNNTLKIDSTCPSSMVMIENVCGVDVTFCKTHFGHGLGLRRCLTESERELIAGKIAHGVRFEQILDEVNDSTSNIYDTKTLTTKHDLLNICQEYNHHIISNHNKSKLMLVQMKLHQTSDTSWTIESGTERNNIIQMKSKCDLNNCMLRCRFCKICTHLYVCDCIDHILKPNTSICKHIHACVFKINSLRLVQNRSEKRNVSELSDKSIKNLENKAECEGEVGQSKKMFIYYQTNGTCSKVDVSK